MASGPPPVSANDALARLAFAAMPEADLRRLAGEVHESRLRAGHLLYDPEVSVVAGGLVRSFIGDGTGRQATVAYLRPGNTLGLVHLAGRRYPVAFQAIEDTRLIIIGNERAIQLHHAHASLGWATIQELSASYLNDLETTLASYAFGSLRQRLAAHLLALTAEHDGAPVHLGVLTGAVGSAREVISRTLAPLAYDGTLHTDTAGITVTDRHRDHANLD